MTGKTSLMILGQFLFLRQSLPYQSSQHDINFRHPSVDVIGERPRTQFTGTGEETLTLSGKLAPEITGGEVSLSELNTMAQTGNAYPLVNGRFDFLGYFVIEKISTSKSVYYEDGTARLIDFTVNLKCVPEPEAQIQTEAIPNEQAYSYRATDYDAIV